jgi:hypothetical protein
VSITKLLYYVVWLQTLAVLDQQVTTAGVEFASTNISVISINSSNWFLVDYFVGNIRSLLVVMCVVPSHIEKWHCQCIIFHGLSFCSLCIKRLLS